MLNKESWNFKINEDTKCQMKLGPFVDMCIEFFYSTHLKLVVDGVLKPSFLKIEILSVY